jgi:hypothetical protein
MFFSVYNLNWGDSTSMSPNHLMPGAHHYTFLASIDGPRGVHGVDEFVPPLVALPDRGEAGCTLSRPCHDATTLGHAADHGMPRRRALGRTAVMPHGITRVPLARFEHHGTRGLWLGTSRQGHEMETPRQAQLDRKGIQQPLVGLHTHLLDRAAWLEDTAKHLHLPAAPRPLPPCARTGKSGPRPAGEQQPCNRLFTLGEADVLGIDGRYVDRRPLAPRSARLIQRDPLGRHGEGELTRRPGGRASHIKRAAAQRPRLAPFLPSVPLRLAFGEAAMTLGPEKTFSPCIRRAAHLVPTPRVELPVPIGHVPHQGSRTGLLDLARQRIPFEPAVTRLRLDRLAFARPSHRRLWARPPLGPAHASIDARGGAGHSRMEQGLLADLDLHRPHPRLGRRRAVPQKCGIVPEQDSLLRPAPFSRRMCVARQHLRHAKRRISQHARGGHRLRPAVPGTRNTADGPLAQSRDKLRPSLGMPGILPLTLRARCRDPMAHRRAPLKDKREHGRHGISTETCLQDVYNGKRLASGVALCRRLHALVRPLCCCAAVQREGTATDAPGFSIEFLGSSREGRQHGYSEYACVQVSIKCLCRW